MTKLDKRTLLILVFIIGAVANLGYALIHTIPAFVAFRFLSGIQFSFVGTLLMALAGDHLPYTRLTSGMGIYGISGAAASAVAPAIGEGLRQLGTGLRGEAFGFTLMFLFGTVMLALAVIPSAILVPDKKSKSDLESTGAWWKNMFTIHAIPVTIVMFFIMVPHAMIHAYMFNFGVEQGVMGISVFYIVLAVTLGVSRPMGGYLIDRFGIATIMFPALALFSVALFVIGSSHTLPMLLLGAVLAAIGFGSSQPSLQAMCIQTETPLRRGVATNTIYIALDLGLFLGPIIGAFISVRSDFAVMYRYAAILPLLAIVCFAIILPIHKRRLATLDAAG